MKNRLFLVPAALLSLAMLCSFPQSAGAQDCATIERVTDEVRRGMPEAEIRLVSGPAAARLDAGIAALVREPVPAGGSYLIARPPEALVSYVVRFVGGCATHHGRFPEQLLRRWLDGSPA